MEMYSRQMHTTSSRQRSPSCAIDDDRLDVVADRGYFNSTKILACEQAGRITARSTRVPSN
jgi:hypothetical protein